MAREGGTKRREGGETEKGRDRGERKDRLPGRARAHAPASHAPPRHRARLTRIKRSMLFQWSRAAADTGAATRSERQPGRPGRARSPCRGGKSEERKKGKREGRRGKRKINKTRIKWILDKEINQNPVQKTHKDVESVETTAPVTVCDNIDTVQNFKTTSTSKLITRITCDSERPRRAPLRRWNFVASRLYACGSREDLSAPHDRPTTPILLQHRGNTGPQGAVTTLQST